MLSFGQHIKKIRVGKKLSLKDVGKLGGMSHSYLSQIENGKRKNPTVITVRKIAKGLNADFIGLMSAAGYLSE